MQHHIFINIFISGIRIHGIMMYLMILYTLFLSLSEAFQDEEITSTLMAHFQDN